MYLAADSTGVDATGVPYQITNVVDAALGTPPAINPALIDANSGRLLASAAPIKTDTVPSWVIPASFLVLALVIGRRWVFSKKR